MVTIEKLERFHIERVNSLQLTDENVKFAGTVRQFLLDGNSTTHLHVIKSNNDIVGFFKLDINYAASYEFCPENSIGLRSFVLDKNQQGKGLGTAAVKAIYPYLKVNYPMYQWIYLTVNCKNITAFTCYQKGGFEYINEKYLGGAAGPQFIMRGKIT